MSKSKSEEFINTTAALMKATISSIEEALTKHETEEDW